MPLWAIPPSGDSSFTSAAEKSIEQDSDIHTVSLHCPALGTSKKVIYSPVTIPPVHDEGFAKCHLSGTSITCSPAPLLQRISHSSSWDVNNDNAFDFHIDLSHLSTGSSWCDFFEIQLPFTDLDGHNPSPLHPTPCSTNKNGPLMLSPLLCLSFISQTVCIIMMVASLTSHLAAYKKSLLNIICLYIL